MSLTGSRTRLALRVAGQLLGQVLGGDHADEDALAVGLPVLPVVGGPGRQRGQELGSCSGGVHWPVTTDAVHDSGTVTDSEPVASLTSTVPSCSRWSA